MWKDCEVGQNFEGEFSCRVVSEKTVIGRFGQLSVGISKIIIPAEYHSCTAIVCHKHENMWIGPEGVEG